MELWLFFFFFGWGGGWREWWMGSWRFALVVRFGVCVIGKGLWPWKCAGQHITVFSVPRYDLL